MDSKPTKLQRHIAEALSVDISADSEAVASARIRQYVAPAIGEKAYDEPATEKQIDFAGKLGLDVKEDTKGIASAKISEELHTRNLAALQQLNLKPGDRVRQKHSGEINGEDYEFYTEHIVSSITEYGRVFFKGIGCKSAWPTQIEKITKQHN
ncbi:unnamed protein product [marine sediment metagenome]|uniref:Uncharacterized protein n=1 Tax=marine sediment metagenome TaxID=412755 RepID=X0XG88_9ZZZZ